MDEKTNDFVGIIKKISKLMSEINQSKEDLIKKSLATDLCPTCALRPKTTRWEVYGFVGHGSREVLECVCDRGHVWQSGEVKTDVKIDYGND